MQKEFELLTLPEVAALCRVMPVSIYRWIAESRKGQGNFPLPVQHGNRRKLLFHRSDIAGWLGIPAGTPAESPENIPERATVSPLRKKTPQERANSIQAAEKRLAEKHGIRIKKPK